MQYWGNTYGNPQDAAPLSYYSLGLIKVGDGRCTAWSQFFVEIMRTQGIGGLKGIVIRWKVNETLDASSVSQLEDDLIANNLVVSQGTTLSNLSAKFYVKNWANNLDHSFLELPNSYTAGNTMAQGDEDGLKGQCMNNPWSTFPNHVIVKYGNTYYDPSYGSPTVQNKVDWQNNSISYYGTVIRVRERDMPSGPFRRHYWITAITQNIVEEEINYPF